MQRVRAEVRGRDAFCERVLPLPLCAPRVWPPTQMGTRVLLATMPATRLRQRNRTTCRRRRRRRWTPLSPANTPSAVDNLLPLAPLDVPSRKPG
jgi:hypothetical protein